MIKSTIVYYHGSLCSWYHLVWLHETTLTFFVGGYMVLYSGMPLCVNDTFINMLDDKKW